MKNGLKDVFKPDGILSQTLPHFKPRAAQQEMAFAIGALTQPGEQLVVEAETGTGKTFAYVAPALLSSGKTILSTGTRNLQEQLFYRDMPQLKKSLNPSKKVTLLKGRSNYLCLYRFEHAGHQKNLFMGETTSQLKIVQRWANQTKTGDIGELSALPENAAILPQVTSTVENCLGRDCPYYEDCYLVLARKKAMEADIVVVNHHLFCADLVLKDTGLGELIPNADLVVFDEAHQLPDIAIQYFSDSFTTRQMTELAADIQRVYQVELPDIRALNTQAEQLAHCAKEVRLQFQIDPERGNTRQFIQKQPRLMPALQRLAEKLQGLLNLMKKQVGRHKELDQIIERSLQLETYFKAVFEMKSVGYSYWYETTHRTARFYRTPLSVAEPFQKALQEHNARWVFTSATLTVNQTFDYFNQQLGLQNPKKLLLASPFNYAAQAYLCLPRYLPEPNQPEMQAALARIVTQVVAKNSGGTFVLFTSHRMLQAVAKRVEPLIKRALFVQGETTKKELLDNFVEAGNAVLFGTSSFWEGVDVPGEALRCVMIDKLPFTSPDEPLLQARMEDCQRRGGQPFNDIQIPQAVLALKQGAGRLVRSEKDTGLLILCDTRLVTRAYGQFFLSSLPPMTRTRSLDKALAFLERA